MHWMSDTNAHAVAMVCYRVLFDIAKVDKIQSKSHRIKTEEKPQMSNFEDGITCVFLSFV